MSCTWTKIDKVGDFHVMYFYILADINVIFLWKIMKKEN